MQKKLIIKSTVILGLLATLNGCGGSSDNRGSEKQLPALESDGKSLIFYDASANTQYAYTVDDGSVLNLQGATDSDGHDIKHYNMKADEKGKLFLFKDDLGDNNASKYLTKFNVILRPKSI